MSRKVSVFALLILLNSFSLIIASLLIHKWFIDDLKEIGIFGICEYVNQTNRINLAVNSPNSSGFSKQQIESNSKVKRDVLNENNHEKNLNFISKHEISKRCFQLIWPDTEEAFHYLSCKFKYFNNNILNFI
jgi:hypothetical protein